MCQALGLLVAALLGGALGAEWQVVLANHALTANATGAQIRMKLRGRRDVALAPGQGIAVEISRLGSLFGEQSQSHQEPVVAPSDTENPKCDQACTNGHEAARVECNRQCLSLQNKICSPSFSCHAGCGNNNKYLPKDHECEALCAHVRASICYPFSYEAPADMVSPHHNAEPPPSIEATPAPRVFEGTFVFCNLYPVNYDFEVLNMKQEGDEADANVMTTLGYKQCDMITMSSMQSVGIRAKGKLSGASRRIQKIPSIMVVGQFAKGNLNVEFNRYFAKGDGPTVCNGFPMWETKDLGKKIQLTRGGVNGTALTELRYKECMPTGLQNGDILGATIDGKLAGEYAVSGSPAAVVIGKAGETTALSFEAWTGADGEVSF